MFTAEREDVNGSITVTFLSSKVEDQLFCCCCVVPLPALWQVLWALTFPPKERSGKAMMVVVKTIHFLLAGNASETFRWG